MSTHISPLRRLSAAILSLSAASLAPTAMGATDTATATATVLVPITVTKNTDMNFGNVFDTNGTVTLSTLGVATASTGTLPTTPGTRAAAKFTVGGANDNTFSIDFSGSSTVLSDSASTPNTMAISLLWESVTGTGAATGTAASPTTGTLNASGAATLYVGAALTVGASQVPGTYTGNVVVVVAYN